MTELMQEIAALRNLTVPELAERYERAFGKPPRARHKAWLVKRVAWKLQEQRLGGLSQVAKNRLESLIAEIDFPFGERNHNPPPAVHQRNDKLAPGTTLMREWRGQRVRINVLANGYEYDDVVYRSLSAAVTAITGAHWNARLFFGLAVRKKAQ